jgi:hypothetical protein
VRISVGWSAIADPAWSFLALAGLMAAAKLLASGPEAPAFIVRDFGAVPRLAHQRVLLKNDAIQKELKITEAQKSVWT